MIDPTVRTSEKRAAEAGKPKAICVVHLFGVAADLVAILAIASAAGILRAEDFYKPAHAHIFDAVHALHATGPPVDAVPLPADPPPHRPPPTASPPSAAPPRSGGALRRTPGAAARPGLPP